MDRFDKDISFLESVDRDPMLKELCRQYSIDSFDEKFRVITFPISDLIKRNYEAGYFLSNYPYVLSLYGVRDEQMDNLSTEELPYLATLACLTWHFRRDYFCQGTLTYRSIAEGTLLRLFCHLRELYKKNPTVSTLEELHRTKCSSLPCQPGIYRVLAPEKLPISFIEGSDNLRAKGYPAAILEQKYGQCTDKTVLYIGKANGRGGLRQRVMIAMAMACEPDILIADEPTTALDVTIQAQILELMQSLQKKMGMAIIMITHDLGVIAGMCDEVIVMYAGSVCERGTADNIFYRPRHEYTKGLIRSIPNIDRDSRERLIPIAGTPIDLLRMPKGCPFAPRCEHAMKVCLDGKADEVFVGKDHIAACWMNVREAMAKNALVCDENGKILRMNLDGGDMA